MTVLISSPCFVPLEERDQKFCVADGIVKSARIETERCQFARRMGKRRFESLLNFLAPSALSSREDYVVTQASKAFAVDIFFGDERVRERIDQMLLRGQFD